MSGCGAYFYVAYAAVQKDNEKVERDLENLFEAEVEYVLDELQGKAHKLLEESGKGYECAAGFGTRLAGLGNWQKCSVFQVLQFDFVPK